MLLKAFFNSAILITISLCLTSAKAQTNEANKADYQIAVYLQKINHLSQAHRDIDEENDSAIAVNNQLMAYMRDALSRPEVLTSPLAKADGAGMIMQTSEDKKIRFYAWDTWIGNTMHYFDEIVQYQAGNETKWLVLNDISVKNGETRDPGAYPTEINTIQTKDGNTIYMVSDCTVASNNYKANGIKAYAIDGGKLKTVSFFESDDEPKDNIDYVFSASYDSTNFNPGIIHFSEDKKQLFVPMVAKNGKLSKGFLVYNFDGYKYVLSKKQRRLVREKK